MNSLEASGRSAGDFALAQAAVDAIRLPLLVLDKNLCVVAANHLFHSRFNMSRQGVLGRAIGVLDGGRWNVPQLRPLLEDILANPPAVESREIEGDITGGGRCTVVFNARLVFYEHDADRMILLAMKDVTEERVIERDVGEMLRQKDILLQEMQHRIGNSLQIIASILLLKARSVQSEESRLHLQDAHGRVMSIAAVQKQLQASSNYDERVDIGPYLSRLCKSLADSMIGDTSPISLQVSIADCAPPSSALSGEAVSIGLIVTELVINALKHAFGQHRTDGQIRVFFEARGAAWRLSVSDNGGCEPKTAAAKTTSGLGVSIIEALARKMESSVDVEHDAQGYRTTVTHGAFDQERTNAP